MVVNAVREPVLTARRLAAAAKGRLDREEVSAGLTAAGIRVSEPLVQGLLDEAAEHAARRALEVSERARVDALGRPVYEVPALPGGVDLGALYGLAAMLRTQGMA
ncbi:hypothetical protein GCM10025868_17860 [Angustibacter aerolatus]|uniref:Uncharacterized protein n=1 Tax=Angustibacter aerolatus TaxID=1162965 RepID=A0ABQ6JG54_9ACTN|nr:hypothetical protein GCM10025868_17860 [Angustibacter aerolatus]